MSRRLRLVPEVIQASAMDCGPAALAALLAAIGRPVNVERLHDACATAVDGTSIRTLGLLGQRLGLALSQEIVPIEHFASALPCIAMTRQPDGSRHFVVVWSRQLRWYQVMDPAEGRRWVHEDSLLASLYTHTECYALEQWERWAQSPEVEARNRQLWKEVGLPPPPPVQPVADRLRAEAACRALHLLRREGGVPAAEIARRYAAFCAGPDADLPESAWTSRLSAEGVEVEGALLLRCEGELPVDTATLPPELRAVLDSSPAQPWALLRSLLTGQEHPGLPAAAWPLGVAALLPVALLGMTVAEAVEVLLLRSLLDLGRWLGTPELRLQAALGLGIFLVLRLCGEGALLSGAAWLGRQVEARARAAYLAALPRLRDRYLQSRLISDLAERGQLISFLGQLPGLALRGGGALLTLFFAAAGLIWVDPGLSPAVLGTVLLALVLPALRMSALAEQEGSRLGHEAALGRFYLDALRGAAVVAASGAQPVLLRQQELRLAAWSGAVLSFERMMLALHGGTAAVGLLGTVGILALHLRAGVGPQTLVVLWWALRLPAAASAVVDSFRSLPTLRVVAARLEELFAAVPPPPAPVATAAGAAELRWVEATVQVGERALLQEVSVQIRPGEHVAVVGASGAGKSTLLATLRGHAALSGGVLHIDGIPAGEAEIHALNARTVWVDPAVRLWNRSVYANLCYGAEDQDPTTILEAAELDGLLARSDRSLASPVGEGGGGFSGGEGQRLRLGRGMLRPAPRLVLLDEAFRGLERDRRTRLLAGARSRWAQATLLCVTHDMEQARTFPRVLVVDQGRVVEDGHPEELLTRQGRFAELLSASSALDQALWEAPDWQRLRLGATP